MNYDEPEEQDSPEEETEEKSIVYDEDSLNLVTAFKMTEEGKKYLKKISSKVHEDYEKDWESSKDYRERTAADWKLFAGDLPPKDFPFKDSANPHLPLMLENLSRLVFRLSGELFGDWSNVFGVVPVGPDDDKLAELLSRHGNWQITEEIEDFKRQLGERGVLVFMAHGDVVCHSFYDEETRSNRHEILTCDNFVTPYQHISTQPNLSDCPHYTKVLRMYRHELESKRGIWEDVDKVLEKTSPSWDDDPEAPLTEATGQTLGKTAEDSSSDKELGGESAPFTLLWYEGWLRLPNQDRDRWCQVILDKSTKCILRLTIHERADWRDKERYNYQISERDGYLQATQEHQMMQMQFEQANAQRQAGIDQHRGQAAEALKSGLVDPHAAIAAADQAEQMLPPIQPPPPPPMAPMWMQDKLAPDETGMAPDPATVEPEPIRREPIYLFAHAVCIEPVTGNLGISYGRVQADFNRAANVALSQFTDTATLNNAPGFLAWGLEFEEGQLSLTPGKVNKVTGAIGSTLKDHFLPLQAGQASPQLFDIVKLSIDQAQASIQSPGVLSGEEGKSGETKGGIMSRIEQATKQLSVVTRKYSDFLTRVLMNNAYLNSVFLDEEEIKMVFNTEIGRYEELKLGRKMYERNYRVKLKSDLRYSTNAQRVDEADELVKMWMGIPSLAINPMFGYAVIKGALDARGRQDLVRLMGEPPALPPGMPMPQFSVPPPPGMAPPGPPPPGKGPPPDGPQGGPPKQLPPSGPEPPQNAPGPNGPPQ